MCYDHLIVCWKWRIFKLYSWKERIIAFRYFNERGLDRLKKFLFCFVRNGRLLVINVKNCGFLAFVNYVVQFQYIYFFFFFFFVRNFLMNWNYRITILQYKTVEVKSIIHSWGFFLIVLKSESRVCSFDGKIPGECTYLLLHDLIWTDITEL